MLMEILQGSNFAKRLDAKKMYFNVSTRRNGNNVLIIWISVRNTKRTKGASLRERRGGGMEGAAIISEERLLRFKHEEENPCPGNSIHECIECGNPYLCYVCPDPSNLIYSQTTCEPCLNKLLKG
jgi:hypothetical protein